jgi:ABC-type branched-subunit amino acid transport system ATPase component/ABC-type branched-subunit amino acid transport system permease subunit
METLQTPDTAASDLHGRRLPLPLLAARRKFRLHGGLAVVLAALLLIGPDIGMGPNDQIRLAVTALYLICLMGVNLVFGVAGQITLGPAATFAVGAYATGLLMFHQHWNVFATVPVAMLAGLVAGLVVGAPALRVGGFYLAMVTAVAALTIPSIVEIFKKWTGGEDGLLVPPMTLGSRTLTETDQYRVIIIETLLVALLCANISRSSWGRWFRCLKVSEVGTSALGVSVYRAKVSAFALSSVFGGLAGALYGPYQLTISPLQFGFALSTAFFVAVVLGGLGTLWGPVVGGVVYFLLPEYLLPASLNGLWQQVLFGVAIIIVVITLPNGLITLPAAVRAIVDRFTAFFRGGPLLLRRFGERYGGFSRTADLPASEPTDGRSSEAHRALASRTAAKLPGLLRNAGSCQPGETLLEATRIEKRYGGVTALDGASIVIRSGQITGLIGPNGSGKTTLLNACSGFMAPDAGTVAIRGVEVTDKPSHVRARLGLARTFQHPLIFGDLTGAENVMAGCRDHRTGVISAMLTLPSSRRHERLAANRAEDLLYALGAEHLITRPAGSASLADARILDLARALSLDPLLLLLDEPAAGLGLDEIGMLEALIGAARDSGVGVLLIEHDVGFVTRLADTVVALDTGRVIAEGQAAEVRADPAVLASYFGDEEAVEEHREEQNV